MTTLYSYVVARDYGFAPNPFGRMCTLATCKPDIRKSAQVGDWILGTGSGLKKREGFLVYTMQVSEILTFNQYWDDQRFQDKKPNLRGSKRIAYGDNIYHRVGADWLQLNSHHSLSDGTPNDANIKRDTKADRLLLSTNFIYFGASGPAIPQAFRNFIGHDICKKGPSYKKTHPAALIDDYLAWISDLQSQDNIGCVGRPLDWGP